MNYTKLAKWSSGTVKYILDRHPNGFVGYVVQGGRGEGKSMYAYKVMAKIYMELEGLNEDDGYERALKHMIFSPRELIDLIRYNIAHDYVTPVICLDDATVHFNSYKFFIDLHEVILLKGLFDTIRTAVSGLLMTCPNRRNLLHFLRDYDDMKIQIYRANSEYKRIARCYRFYWYPDEKRYIVRIPYQDIFSCYTLDEYYQPYIKKRKKYLEMINNKLDALMKKKETQRVRERKKKEWQREVSRSLNDLREKD